MAALSEIVSTFIQYGRWLGKPPTTRWLLKQYLLTGLCRASLYNASSSCESNIHSVDGGLCFSFAYLLPFTVACAVSIMTSSSYPIETNSGTVTTWVPLTTAFSAPQSCTTIFRDIGVSTGGTKQAYDPNYTSLDASYSCVPAPVSVWWSQWSESSSTYTTKIAIGPIVCPLNWSAVQTSVKDRTSTFSMCCPS